MNRHSQEVDNAPHTVARDKGVVQSASRRPRLNGGTGARAFAVTGIDEIRVGSAARERAGKAVERPPQPSPYPCRRSTEDRAPGSYPGDTGSSPVGGSGELTYPVSKRGLIRGTESASANAGRTKLGVTAGETAHSEQDYGGEDRRADCKSAAFGTCGASPPCSTDP